MDVRGHDPLEDWMVLPVHIGINRAKLRLLFVIFGYSVAPET
jgi:hypothetical protein